MNSENLLDTELPTGKNDGKIYSKSQIGTATFLGGPLAGTYMIAENFKIFGEFDKVNKTWLYGILMTIAVFTLIFLIPNMPSMVMPITYVLTTNQIVKIYQERNINSHANANGQTFTWGRTIGISVVGLIATLAISFAIVFATEGGSLSDL